MADLIFLKKYNCLDMSKFFGPIVQQGYVVPDIHLDIRNWLKREIGPFFLEKLQNYPAEVDGHSVLVNLSAAFAFWRPAN